MRIRQLLIATASLGFLLDGAGSVFAAPSAAELPKACADAGATTAAECEALLHKAKEGAPLAAAPSEPAAATPAEPPAAPAEPVEPKKPPEPPAADQGTGTSEQKPEHRRVPAPPAAVIPPAAAAAPAIEAAPAAPAVTEETVQHPHRTPAPGAVRTAPAAPEAPAALVAPATPEALAPAANNAAEPGSEPRVHGAHLPKDCLAAGIQSKADCDAFLANNPNGKPAASAPLALAAAPARRRTGRAAGQPPARTPDKPPAAPRSTPAGRRSTPPPGCTRGAVPLFSPTGPTATAPPASWPQPRRNPPGSRGCTCPRLASRLTSRAKPSATPSSLTTRTASRRP